MKVPFSFDYAALAEKVINACMDYAKFPYEAEVNLTLTDNEGIHTINKEFRQIDRPTDVLSFPLGEDGNYDINPATGAAMLGDIVLSMERAQTQAEEYGHSLQREVGYLTVHSMLHLLGYDHLDEGEQKKQMRAREEAILAELGITRED